MVIPNDVITKVIQIIRNIFNEKRKKTTKKKRQRLRLYAIPEILCFRKGIYFDRVRKFQTNSIIIS